MVEELKNIPKFFQRFKNVIGPHWEPILRCDVWPQLGYQRRLRFLLSGYPGVGERPFIPFF